MPGAEPEPSTIPPWPRTSAMPDSLADAARQLDADACMVDDADRDALVTVLRPAMARLVRDGGDGLIQARAASGRTLLAVPVDDHALLVRMTSPPTPRQLDALVGATRGVDLAA